MLIRDTLLAGLAIVTAHQSRAAPPNFFPLRQYRCTFGGVPCVRLPKTWNEDGSSGKSGGVNTIESIDLSYHYVFKAGVAVTGTPAGQPKQCQMNYGQHIDLSSGPNLGFYKATLAQTVPTSPASLPTNSYPLLDFYGNVSAHLTDAKLVQAWYGTGQVGVDSIIDLYPSQTTDKLSCMWNGVNSASIDGSITISYRHVVLYASSGKLGGGATLPKSSTKMPLPK